MSVTTREDNMREIAINRAAMKAWRLFPKLYEELKRIAPDSSSNADVIEYYQKRRSLLKMFIKEHHLIDDYPDRWEDVAITAGVIGRNNLRGALNRERPLACIVTIMVWRLIPGACGEISSAGAQLVSSSLLDVSQPGLARLFEYHFAVVKAWGNELFFMSADKLKQAFADATGTIPAVWDEMLSFDGGDSPLAACTPAAQAVDTELAANYPRDYTVFLEGVPREKSALAANLIFRKAVLHTTTSLSDERKQDAIALFNLIMRDGDDPSERFIQALNILHRLPGEDWSRPEGYVAGAWAALMAATTEQLVLGYAGNVAIQSELGYDAPPPRFTVKPKRRRSYPDRSTEEGVDEYKRRKPPVVGIPCPKCGALHGSKLVDSVKMWSLEYGRGGGGRRLDRLHELQYWGHEQAAAFQLRQLHADVRQGA